MIRQGTSNQGAKCDGKCENDCYQSRVLWEVPRWYYFKPNDDSQGEDARPSNTLYTAEHYPIALLILEACR